MVHDITEIVDALGHVHTPMMRTLAVSMLLEDPEFCPDLTLLAVVQGHEHQEREEQSKCRHKVPDIVCIEESKDDALLVPIARHGRRLEPVGDGSGVEYHTTDPEHNREKEVDDWSN